MKAPEKIYLTSDENNSYVFTQKRSDNMGVEYTRTDVFIEKAEKWIKENLLKHTYVYEGEVGIGMAVFLEEFKQAMKGK